jgi:hypothetical protein
MTASGQLNSALLALSRELNPSRIFFSVSSLFLLLRLCKKKKKEFIRPVTNNQLATQRVRLSITVDSIIHEV